MKLHTANTHQGGYTGSIYWPVYGIQGGYTGQVTDERRHGEQLGPSHNSYSSNYIGFKLNDYNYNIMKKACQRLTNT